MNILVIGKLYTKGFALHIAETLAVMDHGIRRFEPGFRSGRLAGKFGHAEHTYALRLQLLLDNLGERGSGFPMPEVEYGVANVA